jgi:hypothetical protein
MVNIRGDDDMNPDEVLSTYDERHQEEVLAMKADPQVRACVRAHVCVYVCVFIKSYRVTHKPLLIISYCIRYPPTPRADLP